MMEFEKSPGDHTRAHQKLQEMHSFDARNLNGKVQTEAPSIFIPEAVINAFDQMMISMEEAVKDNKINQEKEMREFSENHARNIEKVDEEIETKIKEIELSFLKDAIVLHTVSEPPNGYLTTPLKENGVVKNEAKEYLRKEPPLDVNLFRYYQSYIGQVCLILQIIMYQYVLPDQFAEDWPYTVKDIEEDINDEDLLDDKEREEAAEKWENLKDQLQWDPSLERTLEMLAENSSMDRTECLTVEEAEHAAEELNNQGRLKGVLSYEKVKQIIQMWEISKTLVQKL